ncbi:MAG: hypothetical protein U0U67_00415 [Chitinophagales bacterium]
MKFYFTAILFTFFFLNSFSQKAIKEYWENGNLKFERKYPKKDSIYIVNPITGNTTLEISVIYDSLYFYTKGGKQVSIDSFITLYGENSTKTKIEKRQELKKIKDDSIAQSKEYKKLDKLVLQSKKKNIPFEAAKIQIQYITGRGNDVCGKMIDVSKSNCHECRSTIKAFVITKDSVQFYDIVKYELFVANTKNGDRYKFESTGNTIPPSIRSLIAQMTEKDIRDFEYTFSNVYLKDKDNNYFKIDEYKKFKLVCDN